MKQYIVDAFTDKVFCGNQAAVCVLDNCISDSLMQNIAKENNFSETVFTVKEGDKYHLRWFTPAAEIDFCGHATLGTAFVLFNFYEKDADKMEEALGVRPAWKRKAGLLSVIRADRRVVRRTQERLNHLVWQGGLVFGRKYFGIGVI